MWSIIKGITIDTFVELRQILNERVDDTANKCFMCGIERLTFNKALTRDAFDKHIKTEQNLWNYIYYFIFVWEQDKDDDDGLEYYIRHQIEDRELSWFPMHQAIKLTEHLERGEVTSLQYLFREDLKGVEREFDSEVTSFKDELQKFITRVENTLMFVPEPAGGGNKTRQSRSRGMTGIMSPYTSGSPRDGGLTTRGGLGTGSVLLGGEVHDGLDEGRTLDLTVLSIEGLVIPPEIADRIQCKVISDLSTIVLPCGAPSVDNSGDEGSEGKINVSFDASQRLHCHRGKLPSSDPSAFVVRLQFLYRAQKPGEPLTFIGSVDVRVAACVAAAVSSCAERGTDLAADGAIKEVQCTMEVNARQIAFLLPEQINYCIVNLKVAVGKVLVNEAMTIVSPPVSPSVSVLELAGESIAESPGLGGAEGEGEGEELGIADSSAVDGDGPSDPRLDGDSLFEP